MGRTVLIVEDYDDARLFMKILLESYGYEVLEAENGAKALECLETHAPDLVLMDISLPVVDGLTATRAIRQFEKDKKVPIIAITAFGKYHYQKAMDAGCNDLIDKPVDFDILEPILYQYLRA